MSGHLTAALVCISLFAGLLYVVPNASCKAKWENSGLAYQWRFIGGCMVRHPKGHWLPASAYRELLP